MHRARRGGKRRAAFVVFLAGAFVGAIVTAVAGAERPPERVTLRQPAPSATGTPLPSVRGAQRLPDGNVLFTLADGRTVTTHPQSGRVYLNGTLQPNPLDWGPTTMSDPDGAGQILYWRSCAQASAAGAAPMSDDEPGYRPGLDPDGDGMACDS